jgi:hypothetical protein
MLAFLASTASELHRTVDRRETLLRYRVVRGRHLVCLDRPMAGRPEVHTFATVEAARQCWKEQRVRLACEGYSRVSN